MNWPTPIARDHRSDESIKTDEDRYGTKGRPLSRVAATWSTPRASDAEKGGPNQAFGMGGSVPGAAQAAKWPTPTSLSFNESHQPGNSKSYNETMRLASFLPDLPISTVGEESSKIRRSLNPLFVEWLMGWPRGWTSLALTPPALIGSACSETEFFHYRQRMRFELSRMPLLDALPVQESLFV